LYYGTFTTKNKQAGCAYLEATTKGENFPYVNYNGLAEGFPNIIPGNYKITLVTSGLVKSLVVANLSTKGGSGTVNLTTILGKPYTTGTITLVGRVVIKVPDEAQRLMKAVLDQGS
jgi:hypothetical protein